MNSKRSRPRQDQSAQEGTDRSNASSSRASALNRPLGSSHGTLPATRSSRGASAKTSRSRPTMEKEEEERPVKPPVRTSSLDFQRQEQQRYDKIRSKNATNAPSVVRQSTTSTNPKTTQTRYSNPRRNSEQPSTRGNSVKSTGSSDSDSIVDLVLAKRYAYSKNDGTQRQSRPSRNVDAIHQTGLAPPGKIKVVNATVDYRHDGSVSSNKRIPSHHLRHAHNSSISGTSTVAPPPPVLQQQTHFSQPGAFRMSLGGLPRPAGAGPLISSTLSENTLRTQQEIFEASLVRDRLPDDECPSPPTNLDFTTSVGTHMTAATATTASPISVVEAEPMVDSHTLHSFFASRKVKCAICLLFLIFLVLVLGTLYAVTGFGLNQMEKSSEVSAPTPAPTSPGDLELGYFIRVALPENTRESLRKENSPQSKALVWLKNNTLLETYSLERRVQRFALATIFYATSGERRWERNNGWLSNEDECSWYTVENAGTSICTDGAYEYLSLGKNQLRGTLPDEIALLPLLRVIDLSQNILTGFLPSTLGALSELREIHLYDNYLSGGIPDDVRHLSLLETFDIEFNFIAQVLPQTLAELKSMKRLILDRNLLVGSVSVSIGKLSNMEMLYLSSNAFSGTMPTHIGGLSLLTHFGIDANFFSGTLPSEIGSLKRVRELTLGNNTFSGPVPTELFQSCQELRMLDIFQNSFTGTLPTEVGLLSNAQTLYLEKNSFKGNLPSELGFLSNIATLWLHGNDFGGAIPSEMGRMIMLRDLDLSQNGLTGVLPTSIGQLTGAEILFLAGNSLTGPIPSELGQLSQLQRLALENNMFSGTMPPEVCRLIETGLLAPQNLTVDCSLVECSCCEDCAVSAIQDHNI